MRYKIAIVAGGDSGEYEVSVNSAAVVLRHLDAQRFEAYIVLIRGQEWKLLGEKGATFPVNREDFTVSLPGGTLSFDGIFVALHGTPGEDGKLQGYFDLLRLPYTSCDLATSAITFNKYFCNHYVQSFGARISKSVVIHRGQDISEEKIMQQIRLPFFVKPNRGGSSVGTSKVKSEADLRPAVEKAFREDSQVMLEEFIPGREIACGVIMHGGSLITLPITEIISKNEFFDYEAKYQGKSEEVTPADLDNKVSDECRSLSLKLYRELNCKGIVRFDYILNGDVLYFLEVNTVPGFSEQSIIPQQALAAGITLCDLFSEAMQFALDNR